MSLCLRARFLRGIDLPVRRVTVGLKIHLRTSPPLPFYVIVPTRVLPPLRDLYYFDNIEILILGF